MNFHIMLAHTFNMVKTLPFLRASVIPIRKSSELLAEKNVDEYILIAADPNHHVNEKADAIRFRRGKGFEADTHNLYL